MPAFARRRGGLGRSILFIGAGSHFEIWDASLAMAEGDDELRSVAEYRLGGGAPPFEEEEEEG